jgi:hypothetical protein
MNNKKNIIVVLITISMAPILFVFQNCSNKSLTFSKSDVGVNCVADPTNVGCPKENAPEVTIPNDDLCEDLSQIDGDMRTEILPAKNKDEISTLEFGTYADNYWDGDGKNNGQIFFGKLYERKMTFQLGEIKNISEFKLVNLSFDDWLSVTVNDHLVYVGPYTGDRLEFNINTGAVQYDANKFSRPELSTSWVKTENIDVLKFLKAGINIVKTKTIVAGYGESAIRFKYKMNCK